MPSPATLTSLVAEKRDLELEIETKRKRLQHLTEYLRTFGEFTDQPPASRSFPALGTTAAIVAFLARNPESYFSARDIAEALERDGLSSSGPNLSTTVYTNCLRKVKTGVITQDNSGRIIKFRIAPSRAAEPVL